MLTERVHLEQMPQDGDVQNARLRGPTPSFAPRQHVHVHRSHGALRALVQTSGKPYERPTIQLVRSDQDKMEYADAIAISFIAHSMWVGAGKVQCRAFG